MSLDHLTDEQLQAALREHGSQRACAQALGIAKSTLQTDLKRRGLTAPQPPSSPRRTARPTVTLESLHRALLPPNNCKVRAFLDSLDDESRQVVQEALGYDRKDFTSGALRDWLISSGFRDQDVPGSDSINDHRSGRRPCRCKG